MFESAVGKKLASRVLVPLGKRVAGAHPDHRVIFKGMVWVVLFLLVGKVLGAGKEMVVAYRYGVGMELDAYLMVLNWINLAVGVWYAAVGVVVVPLWARVLHNGATSLSRFRSELLGFTLVLGLILAVVGWIGLPLLLSSSWIDLPHDTALAAKGMIPLLALLGPLGALSSLFSAWILAAGRHTGTLLEGVPPFVIGATLLVLSASGSGIDLLVWSTVAGGLCYMLSLALSLIRRNEIERPRFTRQSEHWPVFWNGFGLIVFGQVLMYSITIIDQFFAVHIGVGAVATLGYSDRITSLLLGLGGVAIARATLPVFSKAQARGDGVGYRVVQPWIALMFAVGVIAALFSWWIGPYAIQMLFQRGAFTAEDTRAVTAVFRHGLLQLPFYFAGLVLISKLLSLGLRRWVAMTAIALFFIKIGGNILLVPVLGLNGIVVATAAMYVCSFILLWLLAAHADRIGVRV